MASAAQKRIKSISYAKYGYMFIAPFFIVYLFFQLWPLINTFLLSFKGNGLNEGTGIDYWVGLDNYKYILFGSDSYLPAKAIHNEFVLFLKNTLLLWFGNFIPQLCLSLLLAVWFTEAKLKIPGKGFFKVVMYMPNIITAASVASLCVMFFGSTQYGAVNSVLMNLGLLDDPIKFIDNNSVWAPRFIVMGVQTWMWFGNTMIMLMSGIMGLNPSIFEAANIDGANSRQVFFRITLPLLRPMMVYTLVTSMIGGLQMFDIPYLMHIGTNYNQNIATVAVFVYDKFYNIAQPKYGYSAAASMILFVITTILGSIVFYMNRDQDEIAKKKHLKKLAKQAKQKNRGFGGLDL